MKCPKCKKDMKEGFIKTIGSGYFVKLCWAEKNKKMYPFWRGLETLESSLKAKRCNKCRIIISDY